MRKSLFKIVLLVICQIICSCNRVNTQDPSITYINIEAGYNKMEETKLSQFTDNIKYVKLERIESIDIKGILKFNFTDDYSLISDYNTCLLFNSEGKFISKIGKEGRGPGEYQLLMNIGFGCGNKIFIQGYMDLYEYNLDGSFSNKYEESMLYDADGNYIKSWKFINDSLVLGRIMNDNGKAKDKALIINKKGEIKYRFVNYIQKPNENIFENNASIHQFGGITFFKEVVNDTLFYLSDNNTLVPRYIFNYGKYSPYTQVERNNSRNFENRNSDFIRIDNLYQTRDFLLLDCYLGNLFVWKRLTPTTVMGYPKTNNTVNALGVYNKQTEDLVFCQPTSTDNPLFASGIYNDIDAGPRFFPKQMVNDSTMVMWVPANQLKDHVASDDFKNGSTKYPEKKRKLQELAESLTEYDNPVLMFVTFR